MTADWAARKAPGRNKWGSLVRLANTTTQSVLLTADVFLFFIKHGNTGTVGEDVSGHQTIEHFPATTLEV